MSVDLISGISYDKGINLTSEVRVLPICQVFESMDVSDPLTVHRPILLLVPLDE